MSVCFEEIEIETYQKPERINIREQVLREKGLLDEPVARFRSAEELEQLFPRYPRSSQPCSCAKENCSCNFMLSFEPTDGNGIKQALEFYGVCVIRNVVEPEQCDRTVASMFQELNNETQRFRNPIQPLDPNNHLTWETRNWPDKGKFLVRTPASSQEAFDNRTNPVMYEIWSRLFNERKLYCTVDNWGVFRGTKDLVYPKDEFDQWFTQKQESRLHYERAYETQNGVAPPPVDLREYYNVREDLHSGTVTMDHPDWRHCLKPHWDLNPWKWHRECLKNEPHLYQGILAIVDCPEPVGGFACVPGSHRFVPEWILEHRAPHNKRATTRVPEGDQITSCLQHFPLRKGEMVIWDTAVVHCNFPNYSDKMRLIQFIRMLPTDKTCTDKDRYCSTRILPHLPEVTERIVTGEIVTTELARKLLGIEPWDD